jgi:Tfp pilus assembly protein PilF
MRIVHIEPPSTVIQGDQLYRTLQPCAALAAASPEVEVYSGPYLCAEVRRRILQAEVLVLCQAVDVDLWPLWQQRAAAGRANVFEINDNFAALQPFNEAARFYANPLIRSLTYRFADSAHGLQFSSHGLQKLLGPFFKVPQQVFENMLANPPPPLPKPMTAGPNTKTTNAPLTIGWGGSLGHRDDIAAVVPSLQIILQKNPQVHFAAMTAKTLHPLFAELPAARCRLHGLGDTAAYGRFVRSLDIGMAPLLDTPFNFGRSDVKYLEYAAAGAVALVQNSQAYRHSVRNGHNGIVFDGPDDLQEKLQGLIDQPAQRLAIRQRAWEEVRTLRQETHWAPIRLGWYQACMKRAAAARPTAALSTAPIAVPAAPVTAPAEATEQPLKTRIGRHQAAALNQSERHLYAGMLSGNDPKAALAHFQEAIKLTPDAHLPHLMLGQREADPAAGARACRRALELEPSSLSAAYTLATRLLQANAPEQAAAACTTALKIAADFAPAHEALGGIALGSGDPQVAQQHFANACQANPFYLIPVARLANLLIETNQHAAAQQHLHAGLKVEPTNWLLRVGLAESLLRQKRPKEALAHARAALPTATDRRAVQALLAKIYLALGDLRGAKAILAARA